MDDEQALPLALRMVHERAMHAPREAVRIELARAGPDVGLVGAGALLYYYHNMEL
jgi:hypothetical protein